MVNWAVFLIVSALCMLTAVFFAVVRAKTKYKSGRILDPSKILFAGVILSAVILFFPICSNALKGTGCGLFETLLTSVHNMLRLFVVDVDFQLITTNLAEVAPPIAKGYSILFSLLFVGAPLLTFGFILSFFKNISAYKRFLTHYKSDVYIFSELNAKSLALAQSLHQNHPKKRFFIFTDVFEREEEEIFELIESAKELGAICFKNDIVTINFALHSKKAQLNFFTIGEDQSENIEQSITLVRKYKERPLTNLYVFSTQVESEMLLAKAFHSSGENINIKVRRINEIQSLIMRNLFEDGYEKIFKTAHDDGSGVKKINAILIGMGKYGTELLKALPWFCQMDGYLAEIHAFDLSPHAKDQFTALCPELMKFSGKLDIPGEAKYTIHIHTEVDTETATFDRLISALPQTTYAFISLGSDEKNLAAAIKLRTLFEAGGYSPVIQTVLYNSNKKDALENLTNFKGQSYQIDFIGDIRSSYSEEVILDSDVEALALKRHLKWGKESEFWQYNYNYRSSIASAIHRKMKILCGIPGVKKAPNERTEAELWNLRKLEHKRWNAYVRSEGYSYGGTPERSGRNDLAKTHNCLIPFDDLPLAEQIKDDD